MIEPVVQLPVMQHYLSEPRHDFCPVCFRRFLHPKPKVAEPISAHLDGSGEPCSASDQALAAFKRRRR